jgi:hypothetical protein
MKSEENPFYYQDFLFDEKDFNVRGAILNIYSDRIFAYYGAGDDADAQSILRANRTLAMATAKPSSRLGLKDAAWKLLHSTN